MKEKIICRVLTGPTASGKTALSLRLAEEMDAGLTEEEARLIYLDNPGRLLGKKF